MIQRKRLAASPAASPALPQSANVAAPERGAAGSVVIWRVSASMPWPRPPAGTRWKLTIRWAGPNRKTWSKACASAIRAGQREMQVALSPLPLFHELLGFWFRRL